MTKMPVISGLEMVTGVLTRRLETYPTGRHQPPDYEEGRGAGSSLNSNER